MELEAQPSSWINHHALDLESRTFNQDGIGPPRAADSMGRMGSIISASRELLNNSTNLMRTLLGTDEESIFGIHNNRVFESNRRNGPSVTVHQRIFAITVQNVQTQNVAAFVLIRKLVNG